MSKKKNRQPAGDRAREAREMAGLSAQQAAALLEIDVSTLRDVEDSTDIGSGLSERIATLYRVSEEWLRTGQKKRVDADFLATIGDIRDRDAIRAVLEMMP